MKEVALVSLFIENFGKKSNLASQPYAVDPITLETRGYDPFGQVKSKTFTAHPKYDPYTDELVVFGYEAKGLATSDVVTYTIDRSGKVKNEFWLHQPYQKPGFIHDCAIVSFATVAIAIEES